MFDDKELERLIGEYRQSRPLPPRQPNAREAQRRIQHQAEAGRRACKAIARQFARKAAGHIPTNSVWGWVLYVGTGTNMTSPAEPYGARYWKERVLITRSGRLWLKNYDPDPKALESLIRSFLLGQQS